MPSRLVKFIARRTLSVAALVFPFGAFTAIEGPSTPVLLSAAALAAVSIFFARAADRALSDLFFAETPSLPGPGQRAPSFRSGVNGPNP